MHRALQILEIVDMICEATPVDGRDLANLARTCSFFFAPAATVLWREQDTIIHLLKCMPDNLWDMKMRFNPPRLDIRLRRSITSADWARPLLYMPRVKSFVLHATFENSDFFEAIGWSLPAEYIFPNLEALEWDPRHPGDCVFRYLNLFLSSHLRNLSLAGPKSFADLCIFEKIAIKCPLLNHFFLGWLDETSDSFDASTAVVSAFVCGLRHLETLNVPDLDDVALAHTAQLSHMKDLTIRSDRLIPLDFLQSEAFPALSELALLSMEQASAMFTALGECSLTGFALLDSENQPTRHVARQFYSTLANSCSHLSLRDIHIPGTHPSDLPTITMDQAPVYSVGGEILEPLFSFINLVSVHLSHPVGFDLDDVTIELLARAWPRIEHLTLGAGSSRHIPSRVTLRGLASFAQHCYHLETLHLTFDASVVSPLQNDETRVPQTALDYLHVALSPVGDPQCVAEYLFEIFPALEDIRTLHDAISTTLDEQELQERLLSETSISATHIIWKDVELKHLMIRNPYP
ncbi:hypothetical protein C8R47DRAFT_564546 [Mycena vitilis]|nr:hypothetical protein C8R47DRAFT_564546 [Mycena vitilis]